MTYDEAKLIVTKYERDKDLSASIVRILPDYVDPPIEGDNGWDVEIRIMGNMVRNILGELL